ncbi:MAG: FprA family A-type flavoprotein [Muribaculaceae bacterium]|nr:FprA family A-type flavoprotein [Muribaculaceae bacterium]
MHQDFKTIGVYDDDIDLFESQYIVPEGISYNSYLVIDEKIALIDTVDQRRAEEWRKNLKEALPSGKAPDYLIVQHLEPDHASQTAWVMQQYPECRMVCTAAARKMLPLVAGPIDFDNRIIEVGDGDTLSLGRHDLFFLTAPMVHWPEVMMVYDAYAATLFSADGFGRFGNPDPSLPWACEARRYYFNIVGKYGKPVQTVLKKLAGKEIKTIAPLHGPVLEGDLTEYLTLYSTWAAYEVETPGVLVAYASIHGMTKEAAMKFADILREKGAPKVSVTDLSRDDMAEAVEDAFRMSHLAVLSPTYDADIFPPMHDFIHHLALKGFCNRRVAIVENGLWAPAAGKKMHRMFEQMKDITIVDPVVTLRGRLTPEKTDELRTLAADLMAE